jgi:hypothetical protein
MFLGSVERLVGGGRRTTDRAELEEAGIVCVAASASARPDAAAMAF